MKVKIESIDQLKRIIDQCKQINVYDILYLVLFSACLVFFSGCQTKNEINLSESMGNEGKIEGAFLLPQNQTCSLLTLYQSGRKEPLLERVINQKERGDSPRGECQEADFLIRVSHLLMCQVTVAS